MKNVYWILTAIPIQKKTETIQKKNNKKGRFITSNCNFSQTHKNEEEQNSQFL